MAENLESGTGGGTVTIGVLKETAAGETRVALIPDSVKHLVGKGMNVIVQAGAGEGSSISDDEYREQGASVANTAEEVYAAADVILRVQAPSGELGELANLKQNQILVSFLAPLVNHDLNRQLADAGVTAMAVDAVPRITRAQSMDALSAMSTIAAYKAVLLAADHLPKFFPLLMTAAGTIRPAKVLVLGAGVAGLQAIATARRLGAVVEAYDVRAVVKEQVESLGAKFVEIDTGADAEAAGGYAREATPEELKKQQEGLNDHIANADVVVTTALVPGRPAPKMIPESAVERMRHGSVIVDLAAETGGNCELTTPGEITTEHGVTIIGTLNLPATLPVHASQMYGKVMTNFLDLLVKDGQIDLNFDDDIIKGMCITHNGEIVQEQTRKMMGLGAAESPEPAVTELEAADSASEESASVDQLEAVDADKLSDLEDDLYDETDAGTDIETLDQDAWSEGDNDSDKVSAEASDSPGADESWSEAGEIETDSQADAAAGIIDELSPANTNNDPWKRARENNAGINDEPGEEPEISAFDVISGDSYGSVDLLGGDDQDVAAPIETDEPLVGDEPAEPVYDADSSVQNPEYGYQSDAGDDQNNDSSEAGWSGDHPLDNESGTGFTDNESGSTPADNDAPLELDDVYSEADSELGDQHQMTEPEAEFANTGEDNVPAAEDSSAGVDTHQHDIGLRANGDDMVETSEFGSSANSGSLETGESEPADASDAGGDDAGSGTRTHRRSSRLPSSGEGTDWVAGNETSEIPDGFPLKGNANSMIYHPEESPSYHETIAEIYFASPNAAESHGYRLPKALQKQAGSAGEGASEAAPGAGSSDASDSGSHHRSSKLPTTGEGTEWVAGDGGRDIPDGFPLKGNANSMIYHPEESSSYEHTIAEIYFSSHETAVAHGYRLPKALQQAAESAGESANRAASAATRMSDADLNNASTDDSVVYVEEETTDNE